MSVTTRGMLELGLASTHCVIVLTVTKITIVVYEIPVPDAVDGRTVLVTLTSTLDV